MRFQSQPLCHRWYQTLLRRLPGRSCDRAWRPELLKYSAFFNFGCEYLKSKQGTSPVRENFTQVNFRPLYRHKQHVSNPPPARFPLVTRTRPPSFMTEAMTEASNEVLDFRSENERS